MRVSIDLNALMHNATALKKTVGSLYTVLKCDAYGHGAAVCARALHRAGIRKYAVFSLSEALEIHPYAPASEILILGRTNGKDLPLVSKKGFIQTVFSEEYAEEIHACGCNAKLHVKIDTGMNRSGFTANAVKLEEQLDTDLLSGIEKIGEIKTLAKYYFAAAVINDSISSIDDVYQLFDDYIVGGGTYEELQRLMIEVLVTSGIMTKQVYEASKKAREKQLEAFKKLLN
jgi:hypothetical protein